MNEMPAAGQIPAEIGVGTRLAAARAQLGLSVEDVSHQLKLSARQIEALEKDDYRAFPSILFARGFIRNYARLLKLDPEDLLKSAQPLLAAMPQPSRTPTMTLVPFRSGGMLPWQKYSLSFLALLMFVWLGYEILRSRPSAPEQGAAAPAPHEEASPQAEGGEPSGAPAAETTSEIAAAPKPAAEAAKETQKSAPAPAPDARPKAAEPQKTPAAEAPKAPAPPEKTAAAQERKPAQELPAARSAVHFFFEQDSWVEVKAADGRVIYSRRNVPAGTRQGVRVTVPFTLTIGNAAGVKVEYRQRSLDLTPHTTNNVAHLTIE